MSPARSAAARRSPMIMKSEHMRYMGTLGLLSECSVYVPEDIREMIEDAFREARTKPQYL